MTYDPNKKEIWLISSMGFWREGTVNKSEYMIKKLCTWEEAKAYEQAYADMNQRHYEAIRAVEEQNRAERRAFLQDSLF